MIPSNNNILTTELEIVEQPSKIYSLNTDTNIISGFCDELEAMRQAVYKVLNTERYEYLIYSWDYGIETIDLYGEPDTYVCPELQRRITEALTMDSRILYVDSFEFETKKGVISTSFTVHTIYGDIDTDKVVEI